MPEKPVNVLLHAFIGAIIALVIAFVICWAGVKQGFTNVTAPALSNESGANLVSRAAINLYAIHHVTLQGKGKVTTFSGPVNVSDSVLLPSTIWMVIPALALIAGGFVAARLSNGGQRHSALVSSLLCGLIYAAILCAGALFVKAKLDPSALPAVDGTSFNPHDISLSPNLLCTALSTGIIGLFFAYLGGMLVMRGIRQLQPNAGQWWVCGKALVIVAISLQIILMAGIAALVAKAPASKMQGTSRTQIFGISPTLTGTAYSLIYGATLAGNVESPIKTDEGSLGGNANMYSGINVTGKGQETRHLRTLAIAAVALIAALMAFTTGLFAVKWGSRGGAVVTALKLTFLQAVYLAVLALFCRTGWSSSESAAAYKLVIGLHYGLPGTICLFGWFLFALLGAYLTSRWYVSGRGYL